MATRSQPTFGKAHWFQVQMSLLGICTFAKKQPGREGIKGSYIEISMAVYGDVLCRPYFVNMSQLGLGSFASQFENMHEE
ncbi:MAG TPA: hypothetical protein PKJ20_03930 [Bacillota bacterium]|nr:hypothetical protein [Bacillota bacterium]